MIMDYKDELRKWIDVVKQQSFSAPLATTLDDLKTLSAATKDLSDRVEMRVRKSLQQADDKAKAKPKSKASKKVKPFKAVKPPKPSTPNQNNPNNVVPSQQSNNLPTSNPTSSSAFTSADLNRLRTDFVANRSVITPTPPTPPLSTSTD